MSDLAVMAQDCLTEQNQTIHPLLEKVISQVQPELLEPSHQSTLAAVLAYVQRRSKSWPTSASIELRMALEGLMELRKKLSMNAIELSLSLRKQKAVGALFTSKTSNP